MIVSGSIGDEMDIRKNGILDRIAEIPALQDNNEELNIDKYKVWLLPIRNTVNTRLFGACKPEKIIFDLSHYAKSRPAWETGGFFAWIDGKEAQK